MPFDEVLSRCVAQWRREGIPLSPPVDRAEVLRVWNSFGARVSDEVLLLYSTVGGFGDYRFDERFFWSFWPWSFLIEQNSGRSQRGVQFCDHSIQIVTWELRFEDDRHSSVWRTDADCESAPSLESFFQRYLDDPYRLL